MGPLCRSGLLTANLLIICLAQSGPSGAPAFDVVSVKPSGSTLAQLAGDESVTMTSRVCQYSKGRLTCNQPLMGFIQEAYSIPKSWQVAGPGWINFEKYDFQATMPPETTRETARQMLQTMLVERFGLKFH